MDIPLISAPRTAVLAALPLLAVLAAPGTASADRARVQSLGGVDLLVEDDSDIFLNPAHIGAYSNRAWFSLGVTGSGGAVGFDPHGGGAVRIRDVFNLGVVLNRSPQAYGFGNAMWPVVNVYIPGGPGGTLSGSDGPAEVTAPLRFPVDLFVGYGNKDTAFRAGMNLYYAGGANRVWEVEDADQDNLENRGVTRMQTHLFNVTLGVAVGRTTDRVRPEGWVRIGNLAAWVDEQGFRDAPAGEDGDPIIDRILSLDRDVRVGAGFRVPIGDATALRGVVVTPGLRYDVAFGTFRFDDNLVNPDSDAEKAERAVTAHHARLGVGIAGRADDLLVVGSASLVTTVLSTKDTTIASDTDIDQSVAQTVDFALPELSIGAEYRVLPVLLIRAGIRSTVGAGRTITTNSTFTGPEDDLFKSDVSQVIVPQAVGVAFEANGGIGLHVRRFKLDATLGGLFLGQAGTSFFSRIDLSFSFD